MKLEEKTYAVLVGISTERIRDLLSVRLLTLKRSKE